MSRSVVCSGVPWGKSYVVSSILDCRQKHGGLSLDRDRIIPRSPGLLLTQIQSSSWKPTLPLRGRTSPNRRLRASGGLRRLGGPGARCRSDVGHADVCHYGALAARARIELIDLRTVLFAGSVCLRRIDDYALAEGCGGKV
jgi:hypothetical protein